MLHVLEALEQFRLNLLEDNFVLKEKDVGVEDGGIFLSGYLDHAFPQRPDLVRSGLQRPVEAHQLRIHFFRGNIVRYGFLGTADLNFNFAQGNAGGNGNALKPGFFR